MSITSEEAIKILQHLAEIISSGGYQEAFKMAVSALRPITREQVEKVWRGEWIHAMPILGSGDEELRCSKCGNIVGFETAFCPYCGSPMTDKAVDMVMDRSERLRDE